jgi:diguanylate cyclase (GGDEF)-like protein
MVADRLRQRLALDVPEVTASVGVASFAVDAPDAETLLKVADVALYQAKHGGRNQVMKAGAGPTNADFVPLA